MESYKIYYRRNLPHYQPPGYTFFITFRLAGSLPNEVIFKLKSEYDDNLKRIAIIKNTKERNSEYYNYQSVYFKKFDEYLDNSSHGPKWLSEERTASCVKEAIHMRDKKEYDLIAYTLMPNHVHIVFTPYVERSKASFISSKESSKPEKINEAGASLYIVSKILQDLKSKTGIKCNKLLNRHGQFWQHESYDHVVRDEEQLRRIVRYTINNPVKAGLITDCDSYKYSYYNPEYLI